MNRTHVVQVRVTEGEYQELRKAAYAGGLSVSEHMRAVLFGVLSAEAPKDRGVGMVCERCGAEVEKLTMDKEMKRVCYGCALG